MARYRLRAHHSAMQTKNHLLLPASILFAGAMIGAGLYFGLRNHQQADVNLSTVTAVATSSAVSTTPLQTNTKKPSEPNPRVDNVSTEIQAKVAAELSALLEQHRNDIVKACWAPSLEIDPVPASATFHVRALVRPDGTVGSFGVNDALAKSRLDVSQCLRVIKLPLRMTAPGMTVGVQIQFTLPSASRSL
jgi:hypothetical protein